MPMKSIPLWSIKVNRSRLKNFVSFLSKLLDYVILKWKIRKERGEKYVCFIAGMVGVIVGALIVTASAALHSSYKERKEVRYRELEHLVKEIESLNLLNKKSKKFYKSVNYI